MCFCSCVWKRGWFLESISNPPQADHFIGICAFQVKEVLFWTAVIRYSKKISNIEHRIMNDEVLFGQPHLVDIHA